MIKDTQYYKQVQLLVRVLPLLDTERCFALKGGTAINLFYRNLPRLSVDIDLLYLPSENRENALKNIRESLSRLSDKIKQTITGVRVQETQKQQDNSLRLILQLGEIRIKIELSPVIRETIFPVERKEICELAENEFGYVEMQVASLPDLYAGKLCAALDRQHPRDLFDVKLLLENEGLTTDLRKTFLAFLISHQRPMSELLQPNFKDISGIYATEFEQMTDTPITLQELEDVREKLVELIHKDLTLEEKEFLLSFKNKTPQWNLLGLDSHIVSNLPSVKWKLLNLSKMNKDKHQMAYRKLEQILNINF